jgi:protein TonB
MKRSLRIGLLQAIILSFLLHYGIKTGLWIYTPKPVEAPLRIEMDVVEKDDRTMPKLEKMDKDAAKQIVDQDEKPLNKEIDEKSKFLSAHDQKVEKQTVAKARGDFKNAESASQGASATPKAFKGQAAEKVSNLKKFTPQFDVAKSVKQREEREQEFDRDPEAFKHEVAKNKPADKKPPTNPTEQVEGGSGKDVSQTIDYIKDLDPGLETLLSTREFVYYTYYARMRRQLNQFWGPKVKEKLIAIYRSGRQIASASDKITRCLITLDKGGNLVKVQIIGLSGVHELDEAAVEAFRAAAPFPNPPIGMVEDDGNIRIRWDFILEV